MNEPGDRSQEWVEDDAYAEPTVRPVRRNRLRMGNGPLLGLVALLVGFYIVTRFNPIAPPSSQDASGTRAATPALARGDVQGLFTVIDGDSAELDGVLYRFWGIDAPDEGDVAGEYAQQAALALYEASSLAWICTNTGDRNAVRAVVRCRFANGAGDVGEWMVRAGYAVDWPEFSDGRYAEAETEARLARRGIWQTTTQSWR